MPNPYVGNPTAVQAPDTGAAAGHSPTINLPIDSDAINSAAIYQLSKVPADYLSYLFSYWNFGRALTSTNTPQQFFKDAAGNVRSLIDHNGFPNGGRFSQFRELWDFSQGSTAATSGTMDNKKWVWNASSASGLLSLQPGPLSNSYPFPYAQIDPGGSVNVNGSIASAVPVLFPQFTGLTHRLEMEVAIKSTSSQQHLFGLGTRQNVFSGGVLTGQSYLAFKRLGGTDTNWQCQTYNGTSTTNVDSGVAPTSQQFQRFTIEFQGSASPYAATTVNFFINGTLVATSTTNITTSSVYYIVYWVIDNGSGSSNPLFMGPTQATWNRWLTPDAL